MSKSHKDCSQALQDTPFLIALQENLDQSGDKISS